MRSTRRAILRSMGLAATAPGLLLARARSRRHPIAFSTLGCPKWDWKTILKNASEWGYSAIELRGIQGEMDLAKRPEFAGDRLKESLKDLAALDLRISDLGASSRMHEHDPARRAQMDEGRRFIDLAARLEARYVRVFGDKLVQGETKAATLDRIVAGLRQLGEHARGSGVEVIMETHGDFADSPTVLEIMKGVSLPQVGVLWDAHHTFVAGKEAPSVSWSALGPWIRHTHLKDSVDGEKGPRYVLVGSGRVPVRDTVGVLARGGYRGYYSFEWEKGWHPEIEEPEVAFPHYAKVIGGYLDRAGVPAR